MNHEHLNSYPAEKVRALVGLTLVALSELLAKALPELVRRRQVERTQRPDRRRAVGPAQRWDAEKRWKKNEPSWTPDEVERVLIDSFESPVRRPSLPARQKRVYSGKKKRHTLKSQVVTDAKGEILDLDPGHRGPTADKRLYEQSTVAEHYPKAAKQGDLAYQGLAGVSVPHKQPKGGHLTEEQRAENRRLATVRVHVEHGIRRIKGWRIVRDDYRVALGLFPLIASTVVGLVQLVRIIG